MIGVLVVTHGSLGKELIRAVEMILGPQEQMQGVAVEHGDDMPTTALTIEQAHERLDRGEGVIVFTDLLGGTPSNVSLTLLNRPRVEVVSGVNLPMLLKAATARARCPFPEVVAAVQKSGREGITAANVILGAPPDGHDHPPGKA